MRVDYKWIALSNTTLGNLVAFMNQTVVMIALPSIFDGLHVNPLAAGQTSLLLWVLLGYSVATTVLLVTFGRISDTYGRVRLYNLGFVVFTVGSLLCALTPSQGDAGAWELIAFRMFQGIGGSFIMANSAAILTDAFPAEQRGLALGVNQVMAIAGGVLGLVAGGVLAAFNWRLVFLASVPFGVLGTAWAFWRLRETGSRQNRGLDPLGNLTFAAGLLSMVVALTYALVPYRGASMGWGNPILQALLVAGVVLLALFCWVESRVTSPMFQLGLFRIRDFAAGNLAGFLASLGRGGLQFVLVIWLQAIWLPLHGVAFSATPVQAGVDTLPMMAGFVLAGPVSGVLSDRYGARPFATFGMLLTAAGFFLLTLLPADFAFPEFAAFLLVVGLGMGLFSAPNTSSIMSSVPAEHRGVASGMRATFVNAGTLVSTAVFFSLVIMGLTASLRHSLDTGLTSYGVPAQLAGSISRLPAASALFAALLGYNPLGKLVPPAVLHHLGGAASARLLGSSFFASLLSQPFVASARLVFAFAVAISLMGAVASGLRSGARARDRAPLGGDSRLMPARGEEA